MAVTNPRIRACQPTSSGPSPALHNPNQFVANAGTGGGRKSARSNLESGHQSGAPATHGREASYVGVRTSISAFPNPLGRQRISDQIVLDDRLRFTVLIKGRSIVVAREKVRRSDPPKPYEDVAAGTQWRLIVGILLPFCWVDSPAFPSAIIERGGKSLGPAYVGQRTQITQNLSGPTCESTLPKSPARSSGRP